MFPLQPPVEPMLAKAVAAVPASSADKTYSYEPKWDGFRAIVYFDGEQVEIGSRGTKMLTRYFPELVDAFTEQLTEPCVLDGEVIVRTGPAGNERLDWEALSQRIHPAESRIRKLSVETPASFVAFDLLAIGEESLLTNPYQERRARLDELFAGLRSPLHVTQTTADIEVAKRWFVEFEGAGLDGVVAKDLADVYLPGKRTMLKIKHARTADVVLTGYRLHKSGNGVGSLLLGLYDSDGELHSVGGASAFTDKRRLELIDELAPLVLRGEDGEVRSGQSERSRFSGSKDMSFVPLEPTRVIEVRYDQMEGMRFRHSAQFERWRPDRDANSCTFEQLEVPLAYDLDSVLA